MRLTLGNEPVAASCTLTVSNTVRVEIAPSLSVNRDTLLYAVCRFIRHSSSLCREYIGMSWQLRLQSGRARRPKRRSFVAPAALLELSRGWVCVSVSVNPAGVTIDRVALCASIERAHSVARL